VINEFDKTFESKKIAPPMSLELFEKEELIISTYESLISSAPS